MAPANRHPLLPGAFGLLGDCVEKHRSCLPNSPGAKPPVQQVGKPRSDGVLGPYATERLAYAAIAAEPQLPARQEVVRMFPTPSPPASASAASNSGDRVARRIVVSTTP